MSSNYFPEIYDAMYASSLGGDIEWYRDLGTSSGGPVLELGAGTGRTLLPIAEAGIDVTGLEFDEGMLELLRGHVANRGLEDRVRLVHGDMRDFELDARFAVIQIPFRAFLHNLTRGDQLACLRCVRNHLEPGGTLALNVFHPSLQYMAANAGQMAGVWRLAGTYEHPKGGKMVVSETNRYDTARQRVRSLFRVERYVDGRLEETLLQDLELAYLYPGDLREILAASGFHDVRIYGGFDEGEFERDGQELVVKARVGS